MGKIVKEILSKIDKLGEYTGNDLGAVWSTQKTTFKVWAPTAVAVKLNLYKSGSGDDLIRTTEMFLDRNGVWKLEVSGDLNGTYYTYSVNVEGKENEVVDLYAKAVGVNGNRGMVIDLSSTNPKGWEEDVRPPLKNPTDACIYEMHIRDTSSDPSSGITNSRKFLGMVEKGTRNAEGLPTGLDHLVDMGITHIQLLPIYDYDGVDELNPIEYNWGYNPKNYNVLEGSYSADPVHAEVRIKEFKQLVKTMHDNGIRVIMDVVYNHTGLTKDSWMSLTVPYYYYRFDENDQFMDGAACENETASEHKMYRKYMIDSVKYWINEYHLDGFRFDLMGIHDMETMNLIRKEMDKIDPTILVYGEGWSARDCGIPESERAVKRHARLMDKGIGCFSDDIRDGLRGHVFTEKDPGFVCGAKGKEEQIKFSVMGATVSNAYSEAWADAPIQTINYASCHDNHTLWDKLAFTNSSASEEDRLKMNLLAAAIVYTSQGIPFMLQGEEMLRTKGGDENSYISPDSVNSIKWDDLSKVSKVVDYYKGLIAFRKSRPALRMTTAQEVKENIRFLDHVPECTVAYTITNAPNTEQADTLCIIYNADNEPKQISIPDGEWKVYIGGDRAGTEVLKTVNGDSVTVDAISAMVLAL